MLYFRTTKKIQTSLHTDEEHLLEFRYKYELDKDKVKVRVDAYKILDDDMVELVPAGCKTEIIEGEELTTLLNSAEQITSANDNPLEYMHSLIASGIKIVITSGGYWKDSLTLTDFN